MLHPEDLAISGRLRARLQEWADAYDAIEFGPNMEVGWRASIPYAEWIAVGRSLAGDLKRELGPDVEILYFDDSTGAEEPV